MSLCALVLRIATVQALKGVTLAEDRVHDSELTPIDKLAADQPKPSTAVYIDESREAVEGHDWLDADREVDLVLASVAATRATIRSGDGPEDIATVPKTDGGLELTLDLLDRQNRQVLLSGDETGWAGIWRRLVFRLVSIETQRGGNDEGTRFAARETVITIKTLSEPQFGAEPEGVWLDFIALCRATLGLENMGDMIETAITSPTGLEPWQIDQARLGVTRDDMRGLGLAPPLPITTPDAEPVETIDTGSGPRTAEDVDLALGPEETEQPE